jgi:hypothetical protein
MEISASDRRHCPVLVVAVWSWKRLLMSHTAAPSQVLSSHDAQPQDLGAALYLIGVLLVLFGLLGVPLFSADIYSGHRLWIFAVVIEEAIAFTILTIGRRRYQRERAS